MPETLHILQRVDRNANDVSIFSRFDRKRALFHQYAEDPVRSRNQPGATASYKLFPSPQQPTHINQLPQMMRIMVR